MRLLQNGGGGYNFSFKEKAMPRLLRCLALFAVVALVARPARAETPGLIARPEGQIAPIAYETEVLENGLRVLYAPLKNAPVVHVRVFYHVGSKDERPDRQGFAHMFEHMMFRGSAHVKPEEHMKLVNMVGGITNAFTSFDQTTYVNTVPAEHTQMALWLEADRMASFKVTEEIYKIERKVVAQEWAMRMNQPYGNIFEEFLKNAFVKHSYRWTPIGNMEHLRAAAVNELQDFFNTYYVPNNAILAIAGDIDIAKTRAWVKQYYGWIPRGTDPVRLAEAEPEQSAAKEAKVPAAVPLPAVVVGVKTPAYKSEDQYALAMLAEIIGGGESGRLDKRLVNSAQPLCRSVGVLMLPLESGGIIGARAILLPGKSADEVEKILKEELALVAEKGVTAEELAKAKTQHRLSVVQQRKTAEDIARGVGEEWLFAGDPARANQELARVAALKVEDVQAVAKKYLVPARMTSLQMIPDPTGQLQKKAAAEATATAQGEVKPAGEPVKARVIEFPADYPKSAPIAQSLTAANFAKGEEMQIDGVKLIAMPENRLPLATFTFVMRRGSFVEPAGKEGLAALTAQMVRRGVKGMSYEQLTELLDSKGIQVDVSDGKDVTNLVGSCPSSQLEEALRIARLILREPTFPAEEFEKLKAQTQAGLMQGLASPTVAAQREMDALLYGDTPLGRSATPKSVASITLEDVKAYHAQVYRPDNAIFIVAGDVTAQRAKALGQSLLQEWPAKGLAEGPKMDLPEAPAKRQIVLVDNPDAKQAAVRIGIRAYTVASADRYAGSLINQILSGGIEARVMRYVRAEKGLAYHAHGVFSPHRAWGAFVGQTDTSIETPTDAIEAMFKVFNDVRSAPVTAEELKESRLRVAGLLVMQMQTIEQQAERRLTALLNGFAPDYWDTYGQELGKVTLEQVQEVMKKYVDTGRMSIVVVAPAEKVKEPLSRLGEVKVKPMPAKRDEMLK